MRVTVWLVQNNPALVAYRIPLLARPRHSLLRDQFLKPVMLARLYLVQVRFSTCVDRS